MVSRSTDICTAFRIVSIFRRTQSGITYIDYGQLLYLAMHGLFKLNRAIVCKLEQIHDHFLDFHSGWNESKG